MISEILADLGRIETIHGVQMLYAVESGSRVWGFASPNSDFDVRFIYLRPLSWYLSVHERRDVIEMPVRGLLDVNGWDLKKALTLLAKSNPPLLEWLTSPTVYHEGPYIARLRALAADYFNARSATYHYLHMASGNYRSYLKGDVVPLKKYFYVLRPLLACAHIQATSSAPPVVFADLAHLLPEAVAEPVAGLLARKKAGDELATGPAIPAVNRWIEEQLERFSELARTTAVGKNLTDDLNDYMLWVLDGEIGVKRDV